MSRHYPVAIELGGDTATVGVVVPDLPGCASTGETLDEALANTRKAAAGWVDATGYLPSPTSIDVVRRRPDFAGRVFGMIKLDQPAS